MKPAPTNENTSNLPLDIRLLFFILILPLVAPAQPGGLSLTTSRGGDVQEIRIGNIGIGIPTEKSFRGKEDSTLAPIQYFILPDGTVTDRTPNHLQLLYPRRGGSGPLSMKVNWVKKDEQEYIVRISYTFRKYDFTFYNKTYPGGGPGPGTYNCTITARKGAKGFLITEDYDYELSYSVKISGKAVPDRARYRGWRSEMPERGYESPGKAYRTELERGFPMDATVDLPYTQAYDLPFLDFWNVLGGEVNTGRYWMAYENGGAVNSDLVGIYQGRPSKLLGANGYGVCFSVLPAAKSDQQVNELDLHVWLERRGPDDSWHQRKTFEWGVFLSTKKDLLPPERTQPIFLEMNAMGGLGAKVDGYADKAAVLNPNFREGSIFCDKERIREMMNKVKTDEAFYRFLNVTDNDYKPVFDAWRYPDSARSVISEQIAFYRRLRANYRDGEGTYLEEVRYWKGANRFKFRAMMISALFADRSIAWKEGEKAELESLVRMMARILWDDDNAPVFDGSGVNTGTANMPTMYKNARYFFALLLSGDPEFKERAKHVLADVRNNIDISIYPNGSSIATPHYSQANIEPVLFTMLQLKYAGVADLFRESPRIRRFADFYVDLLTPPSPRFGGNRKLISFGDGSEEGAVTFALLASGLADVDSAMSDRLYHAFQNGRPRQSIFGPVSFAADMAGSYGSRPVPGSANFKGYVSTFRSAVNTPFESAVWVFNGDSLFDHRNDDAGELTLYAMGAPLSVSRSCFYYPSATDARIRSCVVPLKTFPEWDGKNQPIDKHSLKNRTWEHSDQGGFQAFPGFGNSLSLMTSGTSSWSRRLVMLDPSGSAPVFLLMDSLSGKEPFIWSMPFLSDGAVRTPKGDILPVKRIHDNGAHAELPEGTPAAALPAGLQAFHFTGQAWNKQFHPSGGIDWDLYLANGAEQAFSLANWTNTWQVNEERKDFRAANGRDYEESMQFLRVRSAKPMFTVIVPSWKGAPRSAFREAAPGSWQLHDKDSDLRLTNFGYAYTSGGALTLGAWSDATVAFDGFELSGGPMQVVREGGKLIVRVQGGGPRRTLKLPSTLDPGVLPKGISAAAPGQLGIVVPASAPDQTSMEKGYTEYILNLK